MSRYSHTKNLIRRLKSGIEVARNIDNDFVYITVGDAKRILKILEPSPPDKKDYPKDKFYNTLHRLWLEYEDISEEDRRTLFDMMTLLTYKEDANDCQ